MYVQEALLFINKCFQKCPFIINKKQEAKWILSYVLDIPVTQLMLHRKVLTKTELNFLHSCINQRSLNYPLDYILKSTYFWKDKFIVSEDTLIPRVDTETIITAVLDNYRDHKQKLKILDIGTGTGCLIISLVKEYKNAAGVATDICNKALIIAKQNAHLLNVASQIIFLNEDILESIDKFDIIVSNPPYIDINDPEIEVSVRTFEPKIALFAQNKGLAMYEKIFKLLRQILKRDGKLFLEIGHKQKDDVINIAKRYSLQNIEIHTDSGNKERVLVFSYK